MFRFGKRKPADARIAHRPGINAPIPSTEPSNGQLRQIERKYGMFIHFGINTFHDMEWTDGSRKPASYNPPRIDAEQWVAAAKAAGMTYVILTAKHHDGFCLWDSPLTNYSVASSGNTGDVIAEVALECRNQGVELGLYYSLWDRKRNRRVRRIRDDAEYNRYMLLQLEDLMSSYGDICELWLDGGWVKENWRWPTFEIYELVKRLQPGCQVGINWTIGHPDDHDRHEILPEHQKDGFPFRYFPSDFRLGDPYLPAADDPKIFRYGDEDYYLPWESTLCISDKWFWNSRDDNVKSVEELLAIYRRSTAQSNVLIINCPPGPNGRIRESNLTILKELQEKLHSEGLLPRHS